MKAELLEEPELQFGLGRHVDPRFGLIELGAADGDAAAAPRALTVGVVGTEETIDGAVDWLTRCRHPMAGRADARQPNLFPPFPGFVRGEGFDSELVFDPRFQRAIAPRELRKIGATKKRKTRVEQVARLFCRGDREHRREGRAARRYLRPPTGGAPDRLHGGGKGKVAGAAA